MRHPYGPKFIYFWIHNFSMYNPRCELVAVFLPLLSECWIRGCIILLGAPIDFNGQRRKAINEWRKIVIAWCKEIFWIGLGALGVCCFSCLSHINTCCCFEYLLGTMSLQTDSCDWILSLNSLTYNESYAREESQSVHVGLSFMLTYGGGLWT